jgi:hypothetical protein
VDDLDELLAKGEGGAKPKGAAVAPPAVDLDALLTKGEAAPPPSFADRARSIGSAIAQPFKDIGHGLAAANDFAARAIVHPIDTFGGGKALPTLREGMRGVNENIPFANRFVEDIGGPPAVSPEDAAAAPGARAFGNVAGLPVGGMEGQVAGKALGATARAAGRFGEGAIERSAARGATPIHDAIAQGGKDLLSRGHTVGPMMRIGATAADEGAAAVARRILGRRAAAADVAVYPWEGWGPEEIAKRRAAAAAPPVEAPAPPAAPVATANPQVLQLQEALKTATPEQADMINKAIAGIEARATAPPRAVAAPEPQIAPSLAERAAAIKETRAAPAEAPPGTKSQVSEKMQAYRDRLASEEEQKYARKLGVSVERYRELMAKANARGTLVQSMPASAD